MLGDIGGKVSLNLWFDRCIDFGDTRKSVDNNETVNHEL